MNFPIIKIYYIEIITFAIVLSYYLFAGKNKFPKLWGCRRGYESKLDKYDWEEIFMRDKVYLAISIIFNSFCLVIKLFWGLLRQNSLVYICHLDNNYFYMAWTG